MNPTRQLHDLGQSLWLDNITRGILDDGTLQRYISELSLTGLTSNPTIFDHAIKSGDMYDDFIRRNAARGKSDETLFFELAIDDLARAADLFLPVHDRTDGVDGWVSLEVSPLLANDSAGTIRAAGELRGRAQRRNLFNTLPEKTLAAFAAHGRVGGMMPLDGGVSASVLAELGEAGVDIGLLAERLQREGTESFDASWKDVLDCLAARRVTVTEWDRAGAARP